MVFSARKWEMKSLLTLYDNGGAESFPMQFSPSDEMTGHKCDHSEVSRVLDNGYVEMKLSNSVSVAPFL